MPQHDWSKEAGSAERQYQAFQEDANDAIGPAAEGMHLIANDESQVVAETDRAMSIESTAWLARYGTLPSAPKNRFSVLAYDRYVYIAAGDTSAVVHSYPVLNGMLGMFDQMALQVITDHVSIPSGSSVSVALTAQIGHSADGRNFISKNSSPEVIDPPTLSLEGVTAMEPGYDSGQTPTLGYARIELILSISASTTDTVKAHVKLYVTCNDYREKNFTTLLHHRQRMWDRDFNPIIRAHLDALEGKSPDSSC